MAELQIDQHNSLYYVHHPLTSPEGVTWVFFNALTGDTDMWEGQIAEQLRSAGHGTLSFNFRGQSNSRFDKSLTLNSDLIIRDALRLLDSVIPERPVLCGLSIGGLFAARCWLSGLPQLNTLGLVLINMLRRDGPRLKWINDALVRAVELGGLPLFRDLYAPLLFNQAWQQEHRQQFLQPGPYTPLAPDSGHYNLLKNAGSSDWDIPYEQLKLPVLVVTGMQDHVFLDPADLDHLYRRLPDARHLKFDNAGHILPAERPEELTRGLLDFAAELRP